MRAIRRSGERGRFRNAWLDARLSFSFGDWRDPRFDGWSDLRVFNDDRVAPGGGFAEHGHADVEVMSYPLAGTVEHRDSLGNVARMRPGDVHLMRAGRGIRHSEMNASDREPEHHLQWWIRPARRGLEPGYQRIHVGVAEKTDRWRLLAAPDAAAGVLQLAQDARVLVARLEHATLAVDAPLQRRVFLHVVAGAVRIGGDTLVAGDALLAQGEPLALAAARPGEGAEVLCFDLRGGAATG